MELVRTLAEAYFRPRSFARRIIDHRFPVEAIVIVGGLAFALQGIIRAIALLLVSGSEDTEVLFGGLRLITAEGLGVGVFLRTLLLHAGILAGTAGVAFGLGRAAGGKGSFRSVAAVVMWHSVVIAPMVLVQVLAMSGPFATGGMSVLSLGFGLFAVWLLACYLAEAHRFRSVLPTALSIVGVALVITFAFALTLPFAP